MKGYILSYNNNLSSHEIVKINNYLLGRVCKVKRHNIVFNYYYPGLFDNILFLKLSNGCYFIEKQPNLVFPGMVNIFDAEIDELLPEQMITGREYFQIKYNNERVKNL